MGGINFDFAVPNSRTELETGLGLITQDVYKLTFGQFNEHLHSAVNSRKIRKSSNSFVNQCTVTW